VSDHLERLKAALADRYTIERELGRGGMAVVYLAEDVKHGRHVAVKALLPELAATLGGERFLQEIRVTAKLTHPHILTLIDSGDAGGLLYYVMPYVDGESLRVRLKREKQLSVENTLRIAQQVASALDFAHRHEVIHRDIKPENILLHEGVAMVADFGIALAVRAAGGERLTETGLSIGTPEYMSPEQVAGERDIDARSDIYSLACVLYEMLAGQPPFTGATARAVLARHVTDTAPPITTVRSGIPPGAVSAIIRALAKSPADRFESAKAFADALFAEAKEAEPDVKSIVVLPFENLSPDPDNAFFADGLTEELIADLSKVRELRVISRTSAMQFKGTTKGIPAIAQELNVRHVLEGSVRRAGDNLRITAQLIEAATDTHLWAEKYNGTLDDIFDLQEQLSRQIVDALKVTLDSGTSARLAERPIANAAAYDCYLRAIESMWQFTATALARAVRHLERAITIVGDNAVLHGALAYVYYQHANVGFEPADEYRRRARECANRAFALDPEASLAHLTVGLLVVFEHPRQGIQSLKRVLLSDPNNVEALLWLTIVMGHGWKPEAARPFATRMRAVDPLHPLVGMLDGYLLVFEGRFEEAEHVLRESLQSSPLLLTRWLLAIALAHVGRHEEACLLFDECYTEDPATMTGRICRLYSFALRHEHDRARELLRSDLDVSPASHRDFAYALFLAENHTILGDSEGGLEWVERAVSLGNINFPFLNVHDVFLHPLRGDARFQRLMEEVKRRWETFEP